MINACTVSWDEIHVHVHVCNLMSVRVSQMLPTRVTLRPSHVTNYVYACKMIRLLAASTAIQTSNNYDLTSIFLKICHHGDIHVHVQAPSILQYTVVYCSIHINVVASPNFVLPPPQTFSE